MGHWTRDGSSGQMLWHIHTSVEVPCTTSHCPLSRRGVKFSVPGLLLGFLVKKCSLLGPANGTRLFHEVTLTCPYCTEIQIVAICLSFHYSFT